MDGKSYCVYPSLVLPQQIDVMGIFRINDIKFVDDTDSEPKPVKRRQVKRQIKRFFLVWEFNSLQFRQSLE